MNSRNSVRLSRREFVLGGSAAIAGLTIAKVLGPAGSEAAGSITTIYEGRRRDVVAPAKTFDLVHLVQDFTTTAYLGWHSHDFPVFVLVLDGQATFRSGSTAINHKAGKSIQCGPGLHTMGNDLAGATMRRFVTLLNPPGVPLAVSGQGSFTPKKGPSSVFPTSRGTVAEAPSEFDFAQALFSLDAGATSAPYTTSGYSAWTVISGEVSVKVAGKATNYSPGGFFLLTPGQDAVVSNPGAKEAQLAASIMVAPGAPISTLVAASGASPAIKPPSTGDGGLR